MNAIDNHNPDKDDLLEAVEVEVVRSSCDHLDDVCNTLRFDIINRLDLKNRTELGRRIVARYLSRDDKIALRNLALGERQWHMISSETMPFDGDRETLVTFQYGLIAYLNASPFTYLEGDGAVARQVVKRDGEEDTLTTGGSRKFGPHIDHAWARFWCEPDDGRPVIPDFLTLGGFNNPNRVGTAFADPVDILFELSEVTRYELELPEWSLPAPSSVVPPIIATRLPLVTRGPDRKAVLRINPRIICETHRARAALDALERVLENSNHWHEIVLGPGDIVIARGTALHQRGAVTGPRELAAVYGRHEQTKTRVLSPANRHLEPVR